MRLAGRPTCFFCQAIEAVRTSTIDHKQQQTTKKTYIRELRFLRVRVRVRFGIQASEGLGDDAVQALLLPLQLFVLLLLVVVVLGRAWWSWRLL